LLLTLTVTFALAQGVASSLKETEVASSKQRWKMTRKFLYENFGREYLMRDASDAETQKDV